MSKAGRKIIKGAKEALAVARGEMAPSRVTVFNAGMSRIGADGALEWLGDIVRREIDEGRKVSMRIEIEFAETQKKKRP